MAEQKNANRLISNNKKAYFDYFIEDKYEAGLVLHGTEVKSIRMGKCSIKEAYIQIQNGEVFINNMNITPYEKGNIFNKDPLRPKKLLLHQSEINKLAGTDCAERIYNCAIAGLFKQRPCENGNRTWSW